MFRTIFLVAPAAVPGTLQACTVSGDVLVLDTSDPEDPTFSTGRQDRPPQQSAGVEVTIYPAGGELLTAPSCFRIHPEQPRPHWYEFDHDGTTMTGAMIFPDRRVLHVVDGDRGDSDLRANGVIVDPVAIKAPDRDLDGIGDHRDNCPEMENPARRLQTWTTTARSGLWVTTGCEPERRHPAGIGGERHRQRTLRGGAPWRWRSR